MEAQIKTDSKELIEISPIFGMSEKDYRSTDCISQSLLKEFGAAATPLHFQHRTPKEATPEMQFGSVCHAAILTPEKFVESYHLQPLEYPAEIKGKPVLKPWHGGSDWCKAWLATHCDRPVMTREQLEKIPKIKARLEALEPFGSALKHGKTEVAFFKKDAETGLLLKCRVDLISDDSEGMTWIFDIKKVQSGFATPTEFGKSCVNYGYDVQCAAYLEITGASKFVFVPFDDSEPLDATQFIPDSEMIEVGRLKWRKLLRAYADCVTSNEWPGYPKLQTLSLPVWASKM